MKTNQSANTSTRSQLYNLLIDLYDWPGVKRLAFTLGAPYILFRLPNKRELARRLVQHLEDQNRLDSLAQRIRQTGRYQPWRPTKPDASPGVPAGRVQAVFPPEHYFREPPDYQAALAAAFSLDKDEVVITAVAADTVRLLATLPPAAQLPDFLHILQQLHDQPGINLVSLTLFDTLSPAAQQTWQLIACDYPPLVENNVLRPVITWQQAWRAAKRRPGEDTLPDTEDTLPDTPETAENSPPLPQIRLGGGQQDNSPLPPGSPTNVWYKVTDRPDNNFLPRYQTGDYLLAQTDPGAFDYHLHPTRPILVMLDTPIDGTIQVEPYGKTPTEPARLYIGHPIIESDFLRTDAIIPVRLTKDGEPVHIPQNKIQGAIIGIWQTVT